MSQKRINQWYIYYEHHLNPRLYTYTSNESISLMTLVEVHLPVNRNRKLNLKVHSKQKPYPKP